MAYHTYDHAIANAGIVARAGDWIAHQVRAIGDFYAEQGRLAQLAALDVRTLNDIGLHQCELTSIVHNPRDTTRIR